MKILGCTLEKLTDPIHTYRLAVKLGLNSKDT
jgi:hypothetical protein